MKYYTIIVTALLLVAAGLLWKITTDHFALKEENTSLNKKLMEANLEIGRAHTRFGNANKYIKELEDQIQADIKAKDALVTRIGKLEAELKTRGEGTGTTTVVVNTETTIEVPVELALIKGMLYQAVEKDRLSMIQELSSAYKDFRLNATMSLKPKENDLNLPSHWKYELHQRFRGVMVETLLPSGAINNYFSLWEINEQGETVGDVKLTKFDFIVQDLRRPKWFLWAPHLDVGVVAGVSSSLDLRYGGSIGISLAGRGKTKDDLTWRFLRLSVELQKDLGLGISPVQYNIGDPLPLLSNIWVGPVLNIKPQEKQLLLFLGAVL